MKLKKLATISLIILGLIVFALANRESSTKYTGEIISLFCESKELNLSTGRGTISNTLRYKVCQVEIMGRPAFKANLLGSRPAVGDKASITVYKNGLTGSVRYEISRTL